MYKEKKATMTRKPNVLFILTDQHNAQVLGCAGDTAVRTPNLDRLAQQGVRFEQAYCQNPLCVPSRASLLRGKYSRTIGIYTNTDMMEPNSITIPRVLSSQGYRTCLIGKGHFNGEQFHGYQERPYGDLYGQAHQPDPRRTPESGESGLGGLVGNAGPTGIPLPLTQTEICVAEASKWLQTHIDLHPEQPFFLSVNFDKPHFPVRCPAPYFAHYANRLHVSECPADYYEQAVPFVRKAIDRFSFRDQDGDRYLQAYYGCVEWVDDAIGRLLQVLLYLDLADNTIVIYTSDHGDLLGEKGAWNKTLFFDASTRIPLIVRCPALFSTGKVLSDLVGLIDLFPTICQAVQIPVPAECEGTSFLPVLEGSGAFPRSHLFCESAFLGEPEMGGCMIRQGQWKYTYYLDGSQELYDMAADPEEWNNLATEPSMKHVVDKFNAEVRAFWKPETYLNRLAATPRTRREKHFYEFSNQFILGNGTVANARP
jgi:choline-sulfatase